MDYRKINISLQNDNYDIIIGDKLFNNIAEFVAKFFNGNNILIVTDDKVDMQYGQILQNALLKLTPNVFKLAFKNGEKSKNIQTLNYIYEQLANIAFTRTDLIIAFGGGVVGDITGFAAATYMRGVDFINIPTTLLSQVDSSVGGKTAINLEFGKNLVGAFYQPRLVVSDVSLLSTLNKRECISGVAEIIKMAAIKDELLFLKLEQGGLETSLTAIIENCCDIKAKVVTKDVFDKGERMLLNFGHTFGHAIEREYNYSKYNHGEAVAIGMLIAAYIGFKFGKTSEAAVFRLQQLIKRYFDIPTDINIEKLLPHILLDKKVSSKGITFVIVTEIGKSELLMISPTQLQELCGGYK